MDHVESLVRPFCVFFLNADTHKKQNPKKKAPAVYFVGALLQALLTSVRMCMYVLVQSE